MLGPFARGRAAGGTVSSCSSPSSFTINMDVRAAIAPLATAAAAAAAAASKGKEKDAACVSCGGSGWGGRGLWGWAAAAAGGRSPFLCFASPLGLQLNAHTCAPSLPTQSPTPANSPHPTPPLPNHHTQDDDGGASSPGGGGGGLSPREAIITTLGITPLTLLLAAAALGMAGLNALNGPGWLRPSLGMKPTSFQSRNLVLQLDQEGMLFPLAEQQAQGRLDIPAAWERE